jgi:CRP/FNR family transcriptional regulator, anaerobic regulatory protein
MRNTERLFQVLSSIHPLSEEFKHAIECEVEYKSLPKNYILLETSQVSGFVYFLIHGFAVSYTFRGPKKFIEWIWKSDQIILSPKSFFERLPATESIQVIVQSEVLFFRHESVMRLLSEYPEAHFIYRVVMNDYYELSRERIREVQRLSGNKRLQNLLENYDGIANALPQEQIASYLGVTPQSLSRIKRIR